MIHKSGQAEGWVIIYPDSGSQNSSLKNTTLMDNLTMNSIVVTNLGFYFRDFFSKNYVLDKLI